MFTIKTYKYRLRLSKAQEASIDNHINICRYVYNLAKETKEYAYKSHRVHLSCYDLQKQLTDLKKGYEWMYTVHSDTLNDTIERLDKAYKSFYKNGGYPKWAKKDKYNSITFKHVRQISDYVFKLPTIGTVTIFKDRKIEGELRRATIIKENNKYFICILTRRETNKLLISHENQVGIDMGISFFASLSDGTQVENPRHTLKYQARLRIENRSLARKVKGSVSRSKQKEKVSQLHAKISATRKDFLHKESTKIIDRFSFIAVEDLNVEGMVKNSRLSKHISDCGWSKYFDMLEYKAEWNGNDFIKVDPKYTSQTCNQCGVTDKLSRLSQSKFVCTSCGAESNADINASKNILGKGIAIYRKREAVACALVEEPHFESMSASDRVF